MTINLQKKTKGFTLIEVMVSLTIFSLLVPAILAGTLLISKNVRNGSELNVLISDARLFQQRFTKAINESQQIIVFDKTAQTLKFKQYNESTSTWEDAWYRYDATSRTLIDHDNRTILHNAYPAEGKSFLFSKKNKRVNFHISLQGHGDQDVELNGSAAPRNG